MGLQSCNYEDAKKELILPASAPYQFSKGYRVWLLPQGMKIGLIKNSLTLLFSAKPVFE
jgi:hypothetical protein